MRTAHALTISGGGLVHPRRNFGEKNFKKKKKKFGGPQKIGDPQKNWRPPKIGDHPPEKLETPKKIGDPPCEQNHTRL